MIRLQRGPLEVVDIIPRHWRSRKQKVFSGPSEASQFLRELVFDSGSEYLIRDLLMRALHKTDVNLYSTSDLIERLAREVLYGELKVVISVRESPMPPQVQKAPDLPAPPAVDVPSIPTLPPLQLPKIPSINIPQQLNVLDLAALLGIPLAEICPSTPGSQSSSSGSSAGTTASSDSTPASPSAGSASSPTTSASQSEHSASSEPASEHSQASSEHSDSEHSASEHSSDHSQASSEQSSQQSSEQSSLGSSDQSSQASSDTSAESEQSSQQSSEQSSEQSSSGSPIVHKLTLTDPHFNYDSAMVVPDFESNLDAKRAKDKLVSQGLVDIAYAMELSAKFPHHRLLVAGHTDTMGSASYNQSLSEARANAVLALLGNKKDDWVNAVSGHYDALSASKKKRMVIDLQYVMTWTARYKSWSCDPKGIDGVEGTNTDNAIKVFGDKTGATIDINTASSWLAPTFDLYMEYVGNLPKIQNAGGLDQCVSATNDPPPVAVGFGLRFPLEGSPDVPKRDEVNRRVELIWFPAAHGDSYSYLSDDSVEVYTGNAEINPEFLEHNGWNPEPKLYTTGDDSDSGSSSSPHMAKELTCEQHYAVHPPPDESGSESEIAYEDEGYVYEVQSGDTLGTIADLFYGDETLWYLIWSTNQDTIGPDWTTLQEGLELQIMPLDWFGPGDFDEAETQAPNLNNPPAAS